LIALARKYRTKLGTLETKLDNMDDVSSPVLQKI
jgi:hypothetical protein